MIENNYFVFQKSEEAMPITYDSSSIPIVLLNSDPALVRATKDLQHDIEEITSQKPAIFTEMTDEPAIVVMTVDEKSLVENFHFDFTQLEGKWEHFLIKVQQNPQSKKEQLFIIGSDKRGAIFGIYDLIEKMGKNPWHWWLDIPTNHKQYIAINIDTNYFTGPKVKYRGIFLNDEGPSLMTWARTHFPELDHHFYRHIFDLIIRLKGNYLWPAMWDSSFYEDDPLNIVTAKEYGIVIGTSHHEPMNRPHKDWKKNPIGVWDYTKNPEGLQEFWRQGIVRSKDYETITNLGMRGDGDEPMDSVKSNEEKIQLTEKIIEDQRKIIQEVHQDKDLSEIPQLWALYKEVKEYYRDGMEVPEDIIMLWGDDNWGNIRRLPKVEELNRNGGAGIYYHFDYVGAPRSYKWIASTSIQKIWEQMDKAYHYQANKVWVVNVGDLKPIEYQTDFFLRMAWSPESFHPDNLSQYSENWIETIFGATYKKEITDLLNKYLKFNGRVKPELLNAVPIYSWNAYYEAENAIESLQAIIDAAEDLMNKIPEALKDTFYQLVYYPAKATAVVTQLQLYTNLNQQLSNKNIQLANVAASKVEELFYQDRFLSFNYNHVLSQGKWEHMMDQIHIGYTYWNQPDRLKMPTLDWVGESDKEEPWVSEVSEEKVDSLSKHAIGIKLFNRSNSVQKISIKTEDDWLNLDTKEIDLHTFYQLDIPVSWDKLPNKKEVVARITLDGHDTSNTHEIVIQQHTISGANHFIALNGFISIDAENYVSKNESHQYHWKVIPNYGRTKSSIGLYPIRMQEEIPIDDAPSVTYPIELTENGPIQINVITSPSLPFWDTSDLKIAVEVNGIIKVLSTGDLSQNGVVDSEKWSQAVKLSSHQFKTDWIDLEKGLHDLTIKILSPQLLLQKIVIDAGGLKPSLLGPPPTPKVSELENYQVETPKPFADFTILKKKQQFDKKTETVYALQSGWYQTKAEQTNDVSVTSKQAKETMLHNNKGWNYFAQGLNEVNVKAAKTQYVLEFVRQKTLFIDLSIRNQAKTELQHNHLIQLVLFNRSQFSKLYRLSVALVFEDGSKEESFNTQYRLLNDSFKLHSQLVELNVDLTIKGLEIEVTEDDFSYVEYYAFNKKS